MTCKVAVRDDNDEIDQVRHFIGQNKLRTMLCVQLKSIFETSRCWKLGVWICEMALLGRLSRLQL